MRRSHCPRFVPYLNSLLANQYDSKDSFDFDFDFEPNRDIKTTITVIKLQKRAALKVITAAVLLLAPAAMQLAFAQAWPAGKPITLVVGYPPGGSTDLTARTLGAQLSRELGQTVVIENVGGTGGTIGAQKVASAAPDGYTLLLGSSNEMAISKLVSAAAKYDPLRDFTPIGLVASQPMVLVASSKSGVKTTDEFIKAAKASPGKLSYGSSGVGTALNLAGEMVREASGTYVVHIPCRGVTSLANDLLGGQLDFGVFVLSSGLLHIKSGRVVALGITENKRSAGPRHWRVFRKLMSTSTTAS